MRRPLRGRTAHWALSLAFAVLAACGGANDSASGGGSTTDSNDGATMTVAFTTATVSAAESAGSIAIVVARSGDASEAATVDYATVDGSGTAGVDYVASRGTLSWGAGDAATKSFPVSLMTAAYTGSKTFVVQLSDPSGATVGNPSAETVSIQGTSVASTPGSVQFAASSATVEQSTGTVTVMVNRSGGSQGVASVNYTTQDGGAIAGTNYTASQGTLTWTSGDANSIPVTIKLLSTTLTGSESFSLVLSGANGATLGTPATTMVTITGGSNSAAPGTLAFSASNYGVAQPAGSVTLTVQRTGGSSATAAVNYATHDGSALSGTNYTAATGTLSWADGDASAKTFSIPVSTTAFTGAKSFSVVLSGSSGATLGTPTSATVSITGSGAAQTGSLAFSVATYNAAQSAGTVTLTVARAGGSSGAATVGYATENGTAVAGTNYTAHTGTLTWAAGDATSKTFTVALSGAAFTGSKTFSVALSNVGGATLGSIANATVTITGSGAALGPAAALAAKLGRQSRLLIGIGDQGSMDPVATAKAQGLSVDIYTRYLGSGDWTSWNSPPCDYVCVVAQGADSLGAIPMYVQYQMANDGDGNVSVINDASFMSTYWSRLKLLYQDIATYNKPTLVNLEPDFWGYVEQIASNGDPSTVTAVVNSNPDCSTLTNDVKGIAGCMLAMARKYAPKAYVGFPFSTWGGTSDANVIAFMNAIGAQNADFTVEQTSDRDAGCFEVNPQPSWCSRSGSAWYWDASNATHPNFQDYLSQAQTYQSGIGHLPLVFWQTPEGVPSVTPGGTANHYRDNREGYFLTHASELTAVGGLAVTFSTGETHQTNITTDGGQFQSLSSQYFASPAPLP